MSKLTTSVVGCLCRLFKRLRPGQLPAVTSSNLSSAELLRRVAAVGLVAASVGLGATYAFTTGMHHGVMVAWLLTLMAIALELAKPLAVAGVFTALRSLRLVRGLALAILGAVACVYSFTAELSLVAMSRGDLVAQRAVDARAAKERETASRLALDRLVRADAELAAMPATRPTASLRAEIGGLLLTPGANGCAVIDGKVTREVCPQVAALRTELARAERRDELEALLAAPRPEPPPTGAASVAAGDPGAEALAAFLALLGVVVTPAVISNWLVLVPVLALEVGSAFAGILAGTPPSPTAVQDAAKSKQPEAEAPLAKGVVPAVQADDSSVGQENGTAREEVKKRIVEQLKASGGSKVSSERGLAKLLGTSKPTARRALQSLIIAGVIAAEATRNGTALRLAG